MSKKHRIPPTVALRDTADDFFHPHDPSASDDQDAHTILDTTILLEHLRIRNRPARLDELLRELALPRRDKKDLLAQLDALADRGALLRLAGGRWLHAGLVRTIRGILSVQKSGVGFVTPDKDSAHTSRLTGDVFVRQDAQADAWDGDEVEVMLLPGRPEKPGRQGRPDPTNRSNPPGRAGKTDAAPRGRNPEGRILRVITRGRTELVVQTTRRQTARGVLAYPADARIPGMFDVDLSPLATRPEADTLLRVHLDAQAEPGVWRATALATLGNEHDAAVQERLVKINHQIPMEFPAIVEQEAADLARDARPEAAPLAEREDLRHLGFVTIDGADARDFDDAVHVAATSSGYCLHVAIADVSWYVRPGSALDREARERGNSCYFPLSVEPMLPEPLSTDVCSLRPEVDRFVMVARMDIDPIGRVVASHFMPAVICSRARLTYDGVQAALNALDAGNTGEKDTSDAPKIPTATPTAPLLAVPESVTPMLRTAAVLARILRQARMDRGALDMDLPEPAYTVDAHGRVTAIRKAQTLFAHHLIEEFMLCANEAVARFLAEKDIPFPCRIHPEPDPDRLDALFHTLAASSLPPELLAKLPARPVATAIKPLLDAARGTPQAFVVNRLVLRTMMQARYTPELSGHFGLASDNYCHFTSPIRRYADLIVHRALRHALGKGVGPVSARYKLLAIADLCNVRERAAQDAEREMTRRMACLLLTGREGEVFSGVIAGVMDFGFFVELADMPVEGMVRIATLDDDWYAYDPDRQELAGVGTGRAFRIGQAVTVQLERADLGRLELDLALVGHNMADNDMDGAARGRAFQPPKQAKQSKQAKQATRHGRRSGSNQHTAQTKESHHAPHRQGNNGRVVRGKRSGRG